jgi:hypothetical protein
MSFYLTTFFVFVLFIQLRFIFIFSLCILFHGTAKILPNCFILFYFTHFLCYLRSPALTSLALTHPPPPLSARICSQYLLPFLTRWFPSCLIFNQNPLILSSTFAARPMLFAWLMPAKDRVYNAYNIVRHTKASQDTHFKSASSS